ncbi:hypothetical protein Acid7E03_39690 [Acidisoma sp. 7E03]
MHHGPTMMVTVSAVEPEKVRLSGGDLHAQAAESIPALIDTGAGESCIDDELAVRLSLPVVDKRIVSGVGGQHTVNVYLGYVMIPSLNAILSGLFCGVHLAKGGQFHQVLLGRTLLRNLVMVYDGISGTVTLAN